MSSNPTTPASAGTTTQPSHNHPQPEPAGPNASRAFNMNNPTDPPWSHHTLKLWDVSNNPPQPGGRSPGLPAASKPMYYPEEAAMSAAVLNFQLRTEDRMETVSCITDPAFLAENPAIVRSRKEAFRMMSETPNLGWIIPLDESDGILEMLPDDWGESGYDNICLMLRVDSAGEDTLERIEKFKGIPAAHKMLNLGPEAMPLDLAGSLDTIDWVVADGGPLPTDPADGDPISEWLLDLRDACQDSGVAFYCHSDGEVTELEGQQWLESPFGEKVDLGRPSRWDLKRSPTLEELIAATSPPAVSGDADAAGGGLDDESGRLPMPPAPPPLKPRKPWSPHTAVQQAEVPVVVEAEVVTNDNTAPADLQTAVMGHPSDCVNDGGHEADDEVEDDADDSAGDAGDADDGADDEAVRADDVPPKTPACGLSESMDGHEAVTGPSAGRNMRGKVVLYRDVRTVLTVHSEQFQEKLLCDGLVLNLGDACVFNCAFCYVPAAMTKLDKRIIDAHNQATGQQLGFGDVVIRRRDSLEVLQSQLVVADGSPVYPDPDDNRVVFSSTLVDVAANMELLRETAAACLLILQHTNWQIRLLSKSPLLKLLVEREMIPRQYHHRLVLGFSIGTLDDKVAAAIELNTGLVSQRLKALHWLQDHGIRTFGMICPSLPQDDYDSFSGEICTAIRVDRCEHVWAEVLNVRGDSLAKTLQALRDAGLDAEAKRLEAVFGPKAKGAWEEYARSTFMAHTSNVPAAKLRFLQYITPKTAGWWKDQIPSGAVLLGKGAKKTARTNTPEPAAFTDEPLTAKKQRPFAGSQALTPDDIRYREEREAIVTAGLKASIAAARALHEIYSYRNGLLWKTGYQTFELYCQARWGYEKSQGYLLVKTGRFIAEWEASHSAKAENLPINAGHVRPLLDLVPEEHRVECWSEIVADQSPAELTGKIVGSEARKFLLAKGLPCKRSKAVKPTKPAKADDSNRRAKEDLDKLRTSLAKLPCPERFEQLLKGIAILIDQPPDGPLVDIEATVEQPAGRCDQNGREAAHEKARLDGLRIVAAYLDSPEALQEKPRAVEVLLKERMGNADGRRLRGNREAHR